MILLFVPVPDRFRSFAIFLVTRYVFLNESVLNSNLAYDFCSFYFAWLDACRLAFWNFTCSSNLLPSLQQWKFADECHVNTKLLISYWKFGRKFAKTLSPGEPPILPTHHRGKTRRPTLPLQPPPTTHLANPIPRKGIRPQDTFRSHIFHLNCTRNAHDIILEEFIRSGPRSSECEGIRSWRQDRCSPQSPCVSGKFQGESIRESPRSAPVQTCIRWRISKYLIYR